MDVTILFKERLNDKLLVVEVCGDDIIFGSKDSKLYEEFANLIRKEFEMKIMGELIALQIK